jgi:hypothetical protein
MLINALGKEIYAEAGAPRTELLFVELMLLQQQATQKEIKDT